MVGLGGAKVSVLVAVLSIVFALVLITLATLRYYSVVHGLRKDHDTFEPDMIGPAVVTAFTVILVLLGTFIVMKLREMEAVPAPSKHQTDSRRRSHFGNGDAFTPINSPMLPTKSTSSYQLG